MNNEIGRKITSLTLMTIMLAGGLTFAIPGMEPAFAANANLFVSAENSQFDNYMSGPQVIEVVIIDSDINDTDQAKGEPDVTVNGKILRMAQAVDGNWYGYFADRDQSQIADSTATTAGSGLDFGQFCETADGVAATGVDLSDTVGFALGNTTGGIAIGSANGGEITLGSTTCAPSAAFTPLNVIREAKDLNTNNAANPSSTTAGQIGVFEGAGVFPFIQLYFLSPGGNVDVQYNKGGGAQSVQLTFDTVDQFAGVTLDRTVYPQRSQVHATITDLWLNIDPTDEDSWTFGTNAANTTSAGAHYQVFDENGGIGGVAINIESATESLMCEDNCRMFIDTDAQNSGVPVLTIQDNDDSILTQLNTTSIANNATAFGVLAETAALGTGSVPVTITEQGPNSGVFGTYDEADLSVLKITTDGQRGTSASIDYNETPITVLVGFDFASIDIQPIDDEWSSGEEIPVVIVDGDQNKNSRADEDLDLDNPDVTLIPALTTGDPFTIGEGASSLRVNIFNGTLLKTGISAAGNDAAVGTAGLITVTSLSPISGNQTSTADVDLFSERAILSQTANATAGVGQVIIDLNTNLEELQKSISQADATGVAFNFFNYNVESFGADEVSIYLLNQTTAILDAGSNYQNTVPSATNTANAIVLVANGTGQDYISLDGLDGAFFNTGVASTQLLGLLIEFDYDGTILSGVTGIDSDEAVVADFFSFGFTDDGVQADERIANQIIRIEAEESGDNTSTFEGSLEYVMVNQLNIIDVDTFAGITPIADDPSFIVIEDLTDEDAPRVSYNDLGADGVFTPISDQEEAPSHSGIVSLNQDSYKTADTVIITLEDLDLNVDSDLIDIYTTVNAVGDVDNDQVGVNVPTAQENLSFGSQGRLLDVTFDDIKWQNTGAGCNSAFDDGLGATGFTLVETDIASGQFLGDFQIPADWCRSDTSAPETVTGLDIEVNYVDYRDASGETIEVGDSAGVRASTGSVSLDRTVYPVPFGIPDDFTTNTTEDPAGRSVFPVHQTGHGDADSTLDAGEFLVSGDLTVHIRVNDPDFDINPAGEDSIAANVAGTTPADTFGPVKISVIRGSDIVVLGYAGGPTEIDGLIGVGDGDVAGLRQLGPIDEIAPDAGIYELDLGIRYTDGPASATCPNNSVYETLVDNGLNGANQAADRFNIAEIAGTPYAGEDFCILQGDILQVEYTDPADASGDPNTVTDSATFDLRNGVLQSDKSVYIIGSDMILTLIEPDLDLDNDGAETYDLDLIEWDSDAATTTMGDLGGAANSVAFDPEPTDFRETGDSTGIFQIVIEIPNSLGGDNLERGEEIILEYTDWGPSGSDYVGDEDEDVNITVFTSNFGATVELDQKVY
ncbi:hypothetical protein K0U27_01340, partial [archaeon]|nr:hypothetical protein [archaeon]